MTNNEKLLLSSCRFYDHGVKSNLKHKRKLGRFINELILFYCHKQNHVSYAFISDEELLQLNQLHLQHDTLTDIITFDLSDKKNPFVLADIYISIDRVKDNALQLKIKFQDELLRVMIHGALHICGYNDKTKKEKEIMRALEDKWMTKYLLS